MNSIREQKAFIWGPVVVFYVGSVAYVANILLVPSSPISGPSTWLERLVPGPGAFATLAVLCFALGQVSGDAESRDQIVNIGVRLMHTVVAWVVSVPVFHFVTSWILELSAVSEWLFLGIAALTYPLLAFMPFFAIVAGAQAVTALDWTLTHDRLASKTGTWNEPGEERAERFSAD